MKYLDILVKLRKIVRSINLESKRIEKQHGISIPQLLCLQYLSDQPMQQAKGSTIKSYLHLNASTISGIIKRLETKGLISREPDLKDKRVTWIKLSKEGASLLADSPVTLQEKLTRRLDRLTHEEMMALGHHIDLLIEIMDAEDIDAAPLITIQDQPR